MLFKIRNGESFFENNLKVIRRELGDLLVRHCKYPSPGSSCSQLREDPEGAYLSFSK